MHRHGINLWYLGLLRKAVMDNQSKSVKVGIVLREVWINKDICFFFGNERLFFGIVDRGSSFEERIEDALAIEKDRKGGMVLIRSNANDF